MELYRILTIILSAGNNVRIKTDWAYVLFLMRTRYVARWIIRPFRPARQMAPQIKGDTATTLTNYDTSVYVNIQFFVHQSILERPKKNHRIGSGWFS